MYPTLEVIPLKFLELFHSSALILMKHGTLIVKGAMCCYEATQYFVLHKIPYTR